MVCSAPQYEHARNLILGYFRFSIKDVTNCSDCQNDRQNGHQTKYSASKWLFRHAKVTELGLLAPQTTASSFLGLRPTPESWKRAFRTVNHTNKHAAFPFRAYCLRSRYTCNLIQLQRNTLGKFVSTQLTLQWPQIESHST